MDPKDTVTFCQEDLACTSFAAFEEMRDRGELCDLTIKIYNRSFSSHRVIVAAGIPYFRKLFCGKAVEIEDIAISSLDPEALESLIHFAYSSKVNISSENVQSLLAASQFLEITQIRDACVKFLSERLRIDNVVQVRTFAHSLDKKNLIESTKDFMKKQFEKFSKSDYFLQLSFSDVKDIISEDDLNISTERTVFEAVINWVKNSPSERREVLPELLHEVRMIYLPTGYFLKQVSSDKLIAASKPCSALLHEVKNYHIMPGMTSLYPNLKITPRNLKITGLNAICVPGNSKINIHYSDIDKQMWQKIISHQVHNAKVFHVAAVNEKFYMFLARTITTFCVKTHEWEMIEARHQGIWGTSFSAFGKKFYCFSSYDDSFFDKVRCFCTKQNKWLTEGRMETSRYFSAATSLGNSIYVTGGISSGHLSIVEKYNPENGQWTKVASMLAARSEHACTSMKERIYVCGGFTTGGNLCTLEMYDPLIDQWNSLSSMNVGRFSFSLISHKSKIYALGGQTELQKYTLEMEIYDEENDKWECGWKTPEGFQHAVWIE